MIDRRTLLVGLCAAPFAGRSARAMRSQPPLDVWLADVAAELPDLAEGLADMESRAVRQWHPREWQRMQYSAVIPWRAGVSLFYGFAAPAIARSQASDARASLDTAGVVVLASAFSSDRRAWMTFALVDVALVRPFVHQQ